MVCGALWGKPHYPDVPEEAKAMKMKSAMIAYLVFGWWFAAVTHNNGATKVGPFGHEKDCVRVSAEVKEAGSGWVKTTSCWWDGHK